MKKFILALLFLVSFVFAACEGGKMTPPVAWPNETADFESDQPLNQLPLIEQPAPADVEDQAPVSGAPADTEEEDDDITANPSSIQNAYATNGVVSSAVTSTIKVVPGVFKAGSEVTIWGGASSVSEINSPPFIWAEDLDPNQDYIQGQAASDGSLEFKVVAGYSSGFFTIYVADSTVVLSVNLTVQ